MMKKIFLLVTFFVLGKMWSYAQYPITQNIGSDSTIVVSKGALQSRLINVTYPDTATANLQRIRQYPGAQIATTSGGINLWVRNTTATAWLPINTGSGNNIYTIDGTLTGNRTLTGNNYSLTFTGLSQFLLTVGNQTFTVRSDSASLTRKLSYASNRGSTFTLYSLVDKNYVDSAIASSPAGTVTQINTNNNTGITGGPITSTGTLAIDTLLISTRAWRQKGVDSLQANINLKLNIVDTTGMLANYVNSVGYGLGKTSQTVYVDSASLSNYYLRRKDSLTATNPLGYVTQKILADTAAAIRSSDLGGTVTSVATNNGTGITGGTITTSGTLAIDTTIISTRAWRQKGVDSLQANINLKLNISDTASMLNPYLRKVDTASLSNRINQKLNISDTASMLSPYLRSNTAAATYVPQTRTLTINGTTQDLSANRTYNVGTVTSVGLTMPAAFNVANSPVTGSGTLAVTGAGLASQYIRGDGTLANFPGGGGGGGASVSYYLNGSVNQGTFGGNTYYQMNKTPILGAGTDFTTNTNGYIAQFITNAGDPALLNIPAGNWNFELFFSASSGGGTPSYYVELYKYDGTTFTLIASGSSNPDVIVNSAVDAYFSALPVPQTTLTLTDRLAVRIYVTPAGRTITLHTEDNNLCQVVTTFTTGITAINSLTAQVQYLTTGTSGTDFNISSLTDTHTFNLPVASGTNTGKLSNTDWTTFNNKVGGSLVNGYITKATGTNTIDTSQLFQSNGLIGIGTTSPTQKLQVSGNAYVNGQLFAGDTALSVYQVEGILNTPYVLGRKAVNNTLSTEARPTGVMGHVVGRGSIANRLQAANFYTTTDSASTANSTGSLRSVNAWTAHNGSGSLTTAWGSYNIVQNKTTGTITNAYGSVSGVENRGATSTINKLHGTTTEIWNNYGGTIDTAFGQVISIYNNNAASNIGAVYGLSIGKGLISASGGTHYWRNSGTIGTSYGLYLDSSIDVGTTKYALFSNSNSNSYFRAKLGIGTTSPDSAFQVATGAYFQRGIRASGLPQAAGTKALRIDASGTISYADTLIDAGGTVTSVATNNGTGITGGTITTSGTLAIDTLLISTRAWRQKGVDSVAALANTKVSGSLISGYIPKATGTLTVDTSQIYQNNGNIGIGTISPASGFKVDMTGSLRVGNGSSYNNITINGNSGAGSYLRFQKNGTNKGDIGPYSAVLGGVPPYSGSNDDLTYSSVGGHFFNTNAGVKMYLNNAGNLGLSTSPDSMLTVLEGAYFQRGVRMSGLPSAPGTRALRINANGTLSVADTLVDAGGTVTSVATNNGTGITGGTITTTGTLAIDTLLISTRAWRQKGVDSLQANINQKLNISDTASMLSPYLRTNVAAATYVPQTRTITINGTSQDLSANRTYNVGTVTSVATNTGTGITGGTITSSGTIAADTLLLSTRAWRQKGIDSVAALINSNVSGTTNYVAKFTGTNTIGNSQLFDNGTNVGINTASPNVKLDVVGGNGDGIQYRTSTRAIGIGQVSNEPSIFWGSGTPLTFFSGSELMRITAAGNVGIGTTSPVEKLDVNGNITITNGNYVSLASNNPTYTRLYRSGGLLLENNTFQAILADNGNFGIGTTSPAYKLDVVNAGTNTIRVQNTSNTSDAYLLAQNTLGSTFFGINATGGYIYNGGALPILFYTSGNERMRLDASGNLGLGTTSPSGASGTTLAINGGAGQSRLALKNNTTGDASGDGFQIGTSGTSAFIEQRENDVLTIATNATERMRITNGGNVLVGTTTDAGYKLDVNGIVRATGETIVSGGTLYLNNTDNSQAAYLVSTGTGGSAPLIFATNSSERMRLDASGNLLVGLSSALANGKLQVAGSIGLSGNTQIRQATNGDGNTLQVFATQFVAGNLNSYSYGYSGGGLMASVSAGDGTLLLDAGRTTSTEGRVKIANTTLGNVSFSVEKNGVTTLFASTLGNVGIGTTSPLTKLHIEGTNPVATLYATNGATNEKIIYLQNVAGDFAFSKANDVYNSFTNLVTIKNGGNVGIGTTSPQSILHTNVSSGSIFNQITSGVNQTYIGFDAVTGLSNFQSNTGIWFSTGGSYTERMRITSAGNVGIGTTSPSRTFQVNGYISAFDGTTNTEIVSSGGVGYFGTSTNHPLAFQANNTERMRIATTGAIRFNAYGSGSFTGTRAYDLSVDASGNIIEVPIGAGTITGSGTTNYIPKFTSSSAIGNSMVTDDGTTVTVNGTGVVYLKVKETTRAGIDLLQDNAGTGYLWNRDNAAIQFGTNNTERMRLTSGGLLGIGTSAPQATLEVANGAIRASYLPAGNAFTELYAGSSAGYLEVKNSNPLVFITNGSERMRLDASGNLGLGISSPLSITAGARVMQIDGSSYGIALASSGSVIAQMIGDGFNSTVTIGSRSNHPYLFTTNDVERMRLTTSGNLGLGTSAPSASYKFTISGTDAVFPGLYLNNTTNSKDYSLFVGGTSLIIRDITSTTNRLFLDGSGNLGLGVTPSAWTINPAFQIKDGGSLWALNNQNLFLSQNMYFDGSFRYISNAPASSYQQSGSSHLWLTAPTGTAGNPISFTQAMTLDASGRLGIGTTSPSQRLDVNGIVQATSFYNLNSGTIRLYNSNNSNWGTISGDAGTSGSISLVAGSGNGMFIANGGNVGIGTTSPATLLDVRGNAQVKPSTGTDAVWNRASNDSGEFYLGIDNSAGSGFTGTAYARFLYATNFYPMTFHTNNSERMRITSGGNVGIGTTSPASKLTVSGSATGEIVSEDVTSTGSFLRILGDISSQNLINWQSNTALRFATSARDYSGFTERMRLDASGNLGLGVTPSAWGGGYTAFQSSAGTLASYSTTFLELMQNARWNGNYLYVNNGFATEYVQNNGQHIFFTAPSGTAGNAISFTQAMTLDASGNLAIGSTTALGKLQISTSSGTTIFRSVVALGGTANADNLSIKQDFITGVAANYLWSNSNYMLGVGRNGGTMPTTEADAIALSSFVVNSSGRVGIGTTSPNNRLSIFSGTGSSSFISSAANNNVEGTSDVVIGQNSDDGGYFWNRKSSFLSLGTANTERMRVTNGGLVGIGRTPVNARLEVQSLSGAGTVTEGIRLVHPSAAQSGNGTGIIIQDASQNLASIWAQSTNASSTTSKLFFGASTTGFNAQMTLQSDGNVGIGTTSPTAPLDVYSASYYTTALFRNGFSSNYLTISNSGGQASVFSIGDALGFATTGSTTERMRITSGGNVGIGTTSPTEKLTVFGSSILLENGTNDVDFKMGITGYGMNLEYGTGKLSFLTNITKRLTIDNSGNVGIGTTSPAAKLDIGGATVGAVQAIFGRGNDDNNFTVRYTNGTSGTNNAVQGTIGLDYANGVWADMAAIKFIRNSTAGELSFFTSSAAASGTEKVRITSAGNVGIGTSSPAGKLEIVGSSGGLSLKLPSGEWYGASSTNRMAFDNPNQLFHTGGSGGAYKFRNAADGADVMTITNTGNVGIGTTSPGVALHTVGSIYASSEVQWGGTGAGASSLGFLSFTGGNSAVGSRGATDLLLYTNSAERMRITSGGQVGIGTSSPQVFSGITGLSINGNTGALFLMNNGTHVFSLYNDNSNTLLASVSNTGLVFGTNNTERMRITSGGDLLIATTTDAGAYPLQVNGSVYATAYYESSDLRLKNVLSERQGSDGINTITFKWKDGRDSLTHIGYAAQQVEKVLPDAVKTNTDGYKTINYDEVQSLKIANLEQEIAELKKIIKQLIDKK